MGYQWIARFLANDLVSCDAVMQPFASETWRLLAEAHAPVPPTLVAPAGIPTAIRC